MSKFKSGPAWLLPSSCFSNLSIPSRAGVAGAGNGTPCLDTWTLGSGLRDSSDPNQKMIPSHLPNHHFSLFFLPRKPPFSLGKKEAALCFRRCWAPPCPEGVNLDSKSATSLLPMAVSGTPVHSNTTQ